MRRLVGSPWPVVSLALAVRVVYLVTYGGSPFFLAPMWDAGEYHDIALALSHGKLDPALTFRPPLYPLLLGLIYLLFGAGALLPRLLQMAIGTWSCVLVMRIGERLFGRTAGFLAGILMALSGLMFYFDLELLPTTLVLFLYLLFLYELLQVDSGVGSPLRAGLLFGLGCLARPLLLTFFPVALWWIWRGSQGLKGGVRFIWSAALPLAASLALHLASGSGPVPVSAQGGVNFYIGNHRAADGMTARFPGIGAGWGWEEVRRWAETRAERSLNAAGIDRIYWREGWREVSADPARWAGLMLRKAALFWNRLEISNNRDLYYHAERFKIFGGLLTFGFPLFLPAALAGLVLAWRRRGVRLIGLFILVFFITVIPFFVNARFRHPLTPLLSVLAAGGLVEVIGLVRGSGRADIIRWVGMVLALIVGLALPRAIDSGVDTKRWDYGLFTEGKALEQMGRSGGAEAFYRRALEVNPRAPFVNYHLAELARERGSPDEAAGLYRRELEVQPGYGKAWNNLGVVWLELGEEERALLCFEQALAVRPELMEAARNAGRIWGRRAVAAAEADDWAAARTRLELALRYLPQDPLCRTMHLRAQLILGDTLGIGRALDELLKRHSDFPPALRLKGELMNAE